MKKVYFLLVFFAISAAAGFALWYFLFRETDEVKIRRTFDELVSCVEIRSFTKETVFTQLELSKKASKHFTEIVYIDLPRFQNVKMSRDNIVSNIMMSRRILSAFSVRYYDLTMDFDEKHTECKALFSVMAAGRGNSTNFREAYDLEAKLIFRDGTWLIEKIILQNVLKR